MKRETWKELPNWCFVDKFLEKEESITVIHHIVYDSYSAAKRIDFLVEKPKK